MSFLFVAILSSTVIVSTTVSEICRSFKGNSNKEFNVKSTPEKDAGDAFKQVNAKS